MGTIRGNHTFRVLGDINDPAISVIVSIGVIIGLESSKKMSSSSET